LVHFQIVLSVFIGMAVAAPQFLVDTPEVNAAKAQFFAAYNAAVAATGPVQPAADVADAGYVHEEIAAEPYVHIEIPAEPYIHQVSILQILNFGRKHFRHLLSQN
jgi:hypothetical protein